MVNFFKNQKKNGLDSLNQLGDYSDVLFLKIRYQLNYFQGARCFKAVRCFQDAISALS